MIGVVARALLHRKIARERCAVRGENRITVGPRGAVAKNIVGEVLAADLDPHTVVEFGEFHITSGAE